MHKNIVRGLFILFFIIGIFYLIEKKDGHKNITLVFRYDDPSVYSNTKLEKKILDVFQKHHLSVTFGLIPYRCGGNPIDIKPQKEIAFPQKKIDIFKPYIKNGTLDIALHGYSHQATSTKFWTEFKDVPYTLQYEKILKGKALLEKQIEKPIYTFIPPYNTYDKNTIDILEKLNFLVLSANKNALAPKSSSLKFFSNTITINQVLSTIQEADDNAIITVMFHEYNFSRQSLKGVHKSYISLEKFDALLTRLQKNKSLSILSLSQAYKHIQHD